MIFLLSIVLPWAHAQVITSSFNRNQLAINPAATTTRTFSQVALAYDLSSDDSDISFGGTDGSESVFNEKITLDTKLFTIAGSRGKWVPEFSLSHNQGKKVIKLTESPTSSDQKSTSRMTFVNNLLNLGYRLKPWLGVGLKLARPVVSFRDKFNVNNPDGTSFNNDYKANNGVWILGTGAVFRPLNWLYIGGFYSTSREENDGKATGTDTQGQAIKFVDSSHNTISRMGLGLSIMKGQSLGKGFRFELSYSTMDVPESRFGEESPERGSEIRSSLEYAHRGLSLGANVRLIKNIYYDQEDMVERYLSEQTFKNTFEPSLGGFLSLSSAKGHSFGLSGLYWVRKGKKQFQRAERDAETKSWNLAANYAYVW